MAKIWYSMDSNCHRRCLIQRQITKNWGNFQCQLWRNGWRLKRLKEILEALWLIYVILKRIGKVSTRLYKFSFLMFIGWGRYEWKTRWRQNVPLENCRWSHLTFNPNILMLIPFIYRYLSIVYPKELAINHPWML
jgi:hypothetical protein